MLPSWFAEFALNLDVIALTVCAALTAYGLIVASTGRYAEILKDASQSRRPTVVLGVIGALLGIVLIGLAVTTDDAHVRLTESALATLVLSFAVLGLPYAAISRVWTNAFWGFPPAESIDDGQVRTLGWMHVLVWSGLGVALVGGLIGLIPKLVYVGSAPPPSLFLLANVALIGVGVFLLTKAWRLFQSVRVPDSRPVRARS